MELLAKALVSGAIVAIASEIARRSSVLAAVLVSLPLTSILVMIWLYRDTQDTRDVADLSWSILWVVIPSFAFFIAMPVALRSVGFWPALLIAGATTAMAYGLWIWLVRSLGFDL